MQGTTLDVEGSGVSTGYVRSRNARADAQTERKQLETFDIMIIIVIIIMYFRKRYYSMIIVSFIIISIIIILYYYV